MHTVLCRTCPTVPTTSDRGSSNRPAVIFTIANDNADIDTCLIAAKTLRLLLALFLEDALQGLKVVEPLIKMLLGGRQFPWRGVMVPYHIRIHILQRAGMGLREKLKELWTYLMVAGSSHGAV